MLAQLDFIHLGEWRIGQEVQGYKKLNCEGALKLNLQSTLIASLLVSLNLPVEVASIIEPFAALFSKRVWDQAQVLLVGAILTTGKRTVTSILGVMGLTQERHFHALSSCSYPEVWSSLAAFFVCY